MAGRERDGEMKRAQRGRGAEEKDPKDDRKQTRRTRRRGV